MANKKNDSEKIAENIVKGIQEKKGYDIVKLDLRNIPNAVTDIFVICHGTSKPQLVSIFESIEETVKKNLGIDPWHKEGFQNTEWILLDYVDVVVHIFQENSRSFYKLEELWADAEIEHIEDTQ